jgi:threonine dehydratase
MTVTFDDIRTAADELKGAIVDTPCAYSKTLSSITGAEVVIKFENLQFTGSFKDRGALIKLLNLSPDEQHAGVIAMSAGNHAQGVAYHAQRLGIPATIVMPANTPNIKVVQTRKLGAKVVLEGESLTEANDQARQIAADEGLTFVHPFDDDHIIAGQGTVALEMLASDPDLEALVIPVGGGGLIGGCTVAAKHLKPDMTVIGVEADLFPSMHNAVSGDAKTIGGQTIAEGIAVKTPGHRTLEIVRHHVDDILTVSDDMLEQAIVLYLEIEKTVAEGAGAAGLAALLAYPDRFRGKRVGLVLSGGNIDSRLLASVIMRGLVRDGRVVRFRVKISDIPGQLALVATLIGRHDGNIIDVNHQRMMLDVPAKGAELDVLVETRDRGHAMAIKQALADAGLKPEVMATP